ncbi:MAG: VOC family protein [Pseudomonadales bacterium]|nr:VOC family protein [Pseudomonadales bacterium]
MINIQAIDHIVLRSNKYEQLIKFYCEVLSCEIVRTVNELGLTQLRAGSALIDIIDTTGELGLIGGPAPTQQGNNLDHFCLQIAPFNEDELIQFLKSKNVACGKFEPRFGAQGMGRSLYIKDIIGNTIELRAIQD